MKIGVTTASETLEDIVNALYHIRKDFIKFSSTKGKEGKKNSLENSYFGLVKILETGKTA